MVEAWLRRGHPAATPLCLLVRGGNSRVLNKPVPPACAPFLRLLGAMAHLPPETLVAPPAPGPWVSHVPMWANPALCENDRTFEEAFADLFALPGPLYVGQLVATSDQLEEVRAAYACRAGWGTRFGEAVLDMYLKKVWRPVLGWGPRRALPSPLVGPDSPLQAADRFAVAVALLPTSLEAAAREAGAARGRAAFMPLSAGDMQRAVAGALAQVARGLGWVHDGGPPILLVVYSVKAGTVMQLGPQLSALRTKHLLYVRDAGVPEAGEAHAAGPLPALWPVCER